MTRRYINWGHENDGQRATRRRAAEEGETDAQYVLGCMYELGKGVPQDIVQAHMWFNIAAAAGDKWAIKKRDQFAKRMVPADISEAQRLAREWWAKFEKRKNK